MTPNKPDVQKFPKTKISLTMFLIICSTQIVFSALNTYTFKDHYLKINRKKTEFMTTLLKEDIEYLLSKDIRIDKLIKMDALLGEIIAVSPEINNITIFDPKEQTLYMATKNEIIDFQRATAEQHKLERSSMPISDPEYNFRLSLMKNDKIEGYISTSISKEMLFDKLFDVAMDSITAIVISFLFFVELFILILKFIEKQVSGTEQRRTIHYGIMRPAAFLLLFGIDISMSFLPLHMEKLYEPIFGLSRDFIMGLPISVEFSFAGLAILLSGIWLDRRGWHEPFLSGLFLAGIGILYSWLAPDAIQFIISRAVVGLGYGFSLMASQGFVISYSDGKSKAQGLAHLFAGIYAGSICGGATGAMLAERIGYSPVFLCGAVILFSVIVYTILFMRNAIKKPKHRVVPKTLPSVKNGRIVQFLSNRSVLSLIFFSSLPASIAVVGFLNYFSPIYLNRIGVSQSIIGRVLMIYGICLIYIGPFISKSVDASSNKKTFIFLGCMLGSLAFLTFQVIEGLAAAAVALLLLGLSSSFVLASQSAYALELKVTQELGEGKAIGIFRSTSRIGQTLGPIIFSWLIVTTDINEGITYFGLAYLLTALLFLLLTYGDTKIALVRDQKE